MIKKFFDPKIPTVFKVLAWMSVGSVGLCAFLGAISGTTGHYKTFGVLGAIAFLSGSYADYFLLKGQEYVRKRERREALKKFR